MLVLHILLLGSMCLQACSCVQSIVLHGPRKHTVVLQLFLLVKVVSAVGDFHKAIFQPFVAIEKLLQHSCIAKNSQVVRLSLLKQRSKCCLHGTAVL